MQEALANMLEANEDTARLVGPNLMTMEQLGQGFSASGQFDFLQYTISVLVGAKLPRFMIGPNATLTGNIRKGWQTC